MPSNKLSNFNFDLSRMITQKERLEFNSLLLTAMFGSFPSLHCSTPQGRRDSQRKTMPKREFECFARQHSGHGAYDGGQLNPIQEGVPGLQRGPGATSPHPTDSVFNSPGNHGLS